MPFRSFVKGFIMRSLLYQVLIAFAIFHMIDAYRYYKSFQTKLEDLVISLGINPNILEYQPEDKEWVYKGFNISLIVFAGFAIVGVKAFRCISGLATILVAFIFYNPLPFKKNAKNFQEMLPELDFMLYVCVGLGMIAHSFEPCICEMFKKKDVKEEKKEEKGEKGEKEKNIEMKDNSKEGKEEIPKEEEKKSEESKKNKMKNE